MTIDTVMLNMGGTRGHYLASPTAAFSGEEKEIASPRLCVGSQTDREDPWETAFRGITGVPSCGSAVASHGMHPPHEQYEHV